MKKICELIFLIANAIFFKTPLKNQVLFVCFEGRQYGDNPKQIATHIHEKRPDTKLFWTVNAKNKDMTLPTYFNKVIINSIRYAWIKNRSKIIVSNGAGTMLMNLRGWKRCYIPFIRKKGQIEVATWHGTPLKHIGADIPGSEYSKNSLLSSATVLISSSEYETRIFQSAFLNQIEIQCLGYSRNDCLFLANYDKEEKKRQLGIRPNSYVLLFAPTFRDGNLEMSGPAQMKMIDFGLLSSRLSEKFGGEWQIVLRFHNLVCPQMDFSNVSENQRVVKGDISDDMADYLSVTDILLTDYSGSMFDVLKTGIKCFLFTPDSEEYEKKRGLYIPLTALPFPKAETFLELLSLISDFDEEKYNLLVNHFIEHVKPKNDGFSTKRICDEYVFSNLSGNEGK